MSQAPTPPQRYASFREFYPFYLSEHRNRNCRRMHFIGSSLAIAFVVAAIVTRNPWWLLGALASGYGFAWIGHVVFERNRPASFKQPIYSFIGDWVMYFNTWSGKIRL